MIQINIKEDYTDTPGGRLESEGDYSGETFRDTILINRLNEAVQSNDKLFIDFDGCFGFGTSFLEEAFGGLVRKYGKHGIWEYLVLKSNEDETIPELIRQYIYDAERKK